MIIIDTEIFCFRSANHHHNGFAQC